MPTYEYVCQACGHAFEEFQSITAKPIRKCPACGKQKVKRLIGTGAGVIFKGSGFYETDYRSDSYKKAAKAEKDAASDKSKSKSESKGKSTAEGKSDSSTKSGSQSSDSAKSASSKKADP